VADSTVTVLELHTLEMLDTVRIRPAGELGTHGLAFIPARASERGPTA
jgi:hypothetical protein